MQRRPLEPIPRDEDEYLTPFERVMSVFHQHAARDFEAICVNPIFHAPNYNALFAMLGFDEIPVNPKCQKKIIHPEVAPDGAHPTGFLQFGAQIIRKNHVVFELGNYARIVRVDLKEYWPEVMGDEPRYQMDEIRIWDGGDEFYVDCEDDFYRPQLTQVVDVISNVIQCMWNEKYDDAVVAFDGLSSIIHDLNDISEKLTAQHNAQMIENQLRARENPTNTP
jgi:hypothetical protein